MLDGATEFPCAGSYALLLSPAPPAQQRQAGGPGSDESQGPQLVRIIRIYGQRPSHPTALVSLPLREGASGTREVPISHLTDATALTGAEGKELCDLGRELRQSRVTGRAAKQARYDALYQRGLYAPLLASKLKELATRQRRAA